MMFNMGGGGGYILLLGAYLLIVQTLAFTPWEEGLENIYMSAADRKVC